MDTKVIGLLILIHDFVTFPFKSALQMTFEDRSFILLLPSVGFID